MVSPNKELGMTSQAKRTRLEKSLRESTSDESNSTPPQSADMSKTNTKCLPPGPVAGELVLVDGKLRLKSQVFKPYGGDLFGAFDNSGGMLYLSRIHHGTSPSKKFFHMPSERIPRTLVMPEEKKPKEAPTSPWRNPHAIERKRRFAVSLSTLASRPDKRKAIVDEGTIPVLLKLSLLRDRQITQSCAQAFYHLALDEELRETIIDSGAVPSIINLMSCPIRKVQLDCASTLCHLAASQGYEGKLVQDGIVPALVSSSTISIQLLQLAITILLNLSCVEEKYARIEEVDDAALQFTTFAFSTEVELMLLKCLVNLSGLKGNQPRLIEEGLVQQIHSIAKTSSMEGRVLCSKVLSNLATCTRSRSKMVDHKVIATLLEFLKNGSPDIEQQCALTITRLAGDQTCREKLIQHGAVAAILELSTRQASHVETCRACAGALRTFTSDRDIARRVVLGGGIKALINLIETVEDLMTKQDCTRSLCWLFQYDDMIPRLVDDGAVQAIVDMANPKDNICSPYIASSFYAISWHSICSPEVIDMQVVEALNALCEADVLETRKRSAATLWSLTQQPGKSADPCISIPALLELLRRETDNDISRLCAAALCNLAVDIDNCQVMLDEGAVEPLIALCLTDSISTKIQTGAILCRLASESKNHSYLVTADYIRVLLTLAKLEDRSSQQRSVLAMVHMSQEPQAREYLLAHNAPLCLVQLSNKPDEVIRRACSAALCNLAYEGGSEKTIVKCGAVSCLLIIALVATDNEDTKTTCAKGMFNLLSDPSTHDSMVEDGIIWGFATLSKSNRSEVVKLCATAICNLSIKFYKEVLTSSSIKAVFSMMENGDIENRLVAVKALVNVLSKACKVEGSARLKQDAVVVIKRCIEGGTTEIALLAAKCLTYLSATKAGRQAIIDEAAILCLNFDLITSTLDAARAYSVLLGNIATHDDSRLKAITAGCLDGFVVLSAQQTIDDVICTSSLRGLYSISCEANNLFHLAYAGVIEAARSFLSAVTTVTDELRCLAMGLVFNLTTSDAILPDVVIQGGVKFMREFLWPSEDLEIKRWCSLACCHLAAGCVNSARMVQEGVGPMLIHLATPTDDHDLTRRVSGAFRNLLLVNENHNQLVDDGVIQAIVALFNTEDLLTKQHCAAALRNITYNQKFRRLLVDSGAIAVIIEDSKMEDEDDDYDLPININLLFEIEAESWSNGSRGRQREGRAPPQGSLPLTTSLLNLCQCTEFIEPLELSSPWYKLTASLGQVDEPPLDLSSEFSASSFGSLANLRYSRDNDVDFKTHIMESGKIISPVKGPTHMNITQHSNSLTNIFVPTRRQEMTFIANTAMLDTTGGSLDSEQVTTSRTRRTDGDDKEKDNMQKGASFRYTTTMEATTAATTNVGGETTMQKTMSFKVGATTTTTTANGEGAVDSTMILTQQKRASVAGITTTDLTASTVRESEGSLVMSGSSKSHSHANKGPGVASRERDRQIDELIQKFKKAANVEEILASHRKSSSTRSRSMKKTVKALFASTTSSKVAVTSEPSSEEVDAHQPHQQHVVGVLSPHDGDRDFASATLSKSKFLMPPP